MWCKVYKNTNYCHLAVVQTKILILWNKISLKLTRIGKYFDGTYEEEYTCWPPALSMILTSLVEIVLFCYDAAQGHTDANGPIAKLFIYNPHRRQEAWRFLTYMFVHVGAIHLVVNLLVQLFLGVPLEMVHRWWRVTLVYLAGVAAGSLATSLTDPKVYLAGASGGVYALIAAHIATIIMNWAEMEFAIIQLLVFVLLAAVDVGTAVYERYWLEVQQNIGYVAHLAGAIAGLLVGIGVLRNLEKRKWEKRLWLGGRAHLLQSDDSRHPCQYLLDRPLPVSSSEYNLTVQYYVHLLRNMT
ncbi:hypothetical protein ACJJTC_010856 [Scirpophaga incertulas]